jgi:hypothetical protein
MRTPLRKYAVSTLSALAVVTLWTSEASANATSVEEASKSASLIAIVQLTSPPEACVWGKTDDSPAWVISARVVEIGKSPDGNIREVNLVTNSIADLESEAGEYLVFARGIPSRASKKPSSSKRSCIELASSRNAFALDTNQQTLFPIVRDPAGERKWMMNFRSSILLDSLDGNPSVVDHIVINRDRTVVLMRWSIVMDWLRCAGTVFRDAS